jgi:NitT/TauT family transport system substrate-binding protein
MAVTQGATLYFPVHLASALGYYSRERLDLVIDEVASAPKSMQALLGGSADMATSDFTSVFLMHADGRPVQAFFLLVRDPGYVALVSPRASRPIRQVEDLRGATVGVTSPGSGQQHVLNFILSKHGLKPSDVNVVGVGAGMTNIMALERGKIDVAIAYGTTVSLMQKRHPNIAVLFDLRSPENRFKHLGVGEMAHSVLFANADWMRDHSDTVARVSRATLSAVRWSFSHTPEEIRARLPESMRTEDPAADADAIRSVVATLAPDGRFRREHIESTREILSVSQERIRQSTDMSHVYTNEFIEP